MCVVSMVMDHYHDKWRKLVPPFNPLEPPSYIGPPSKPDFPGGNPVRRKPQKPISDEEIEEFRRLLERAREYDKRNSEPDCENDEKVRKVKELADELGVKVEFLDQNPQKSNRMRTL